MNDRVVDVLAFLYELHFNGNEAGGSPLLDLDSISAGLETAGFSEQLTHDALRWLGELDEIEARGFLESWNESGSSADESQRSYTREEVTVLGLAGCGLLLTLEQMGVLNALQREIVIERVSALGMGPLDDSDLRWIILYVLRGRCGSESASVWAEAVLFQNDWGGVLH
jgi:Smg protein